MTIERSQRSGRKMALALCASGFLAASLGAQDAAVVASDAWVRLPPPSRDQTALFVVLENHSDQRRAVVSASTDAAERAELHEMKQENGMMRMSPVKEIVIPAKGKTALAPGGLHVMLFGLKTRPAAGDVLTVTLKLDDGSTVPVKATARAAEQ
jgi:periplasmic copper chaperone A